MMQLLDCKEIYYFFTCSECIIVSNENQLLINTIMLALANQHCYTIAANSINKPARL